MVKKKGPGGRPTRFTNDLKPKFEKLYRRGFTDKEVADIIGVTEQTLNNWKKRHLKFFESIKDWKLEADQKVVRALYERATGYEHPETKTQYVIDSKGKGKWETLDMIKHYPPDYQSMSKWLNNRLKEDWRDKVDVEASGNLTVEIVKFGKGSDTK